MSQNPLISSEIKNELPGNPDKSCRFKNDRNRGVLCVPSVFQRSERMAKLYLWQLWQRTVHFFTPTTQKTELVNIVEITTCPGKNISPVWEQFLLLIVTKSIFKGRYYPSLSVHKNTCLNCPICPRAFLNNGEFPPNLKDFRGVCHIQKESELNINSLHYSFCCLFIMIFTILTISAAFTTLSPFTSPFVTDATPLSDKLISIVTTSESS